MAKRKYNKDSMRMEEKRQSNNKVMPNNKRKV